MNKRSSGLNKASLEKDGVNSNKKNQRKKELSDKLGSQWNKEELEQSYEAYRKYGKDWKVAAIVRNRSVEMVRALYNMNRAYLSLPEATASVVGLIAMMTDHYNVLDSYLLQVHPGQPVRWAKIIWNPVIPPSKSFLVWRIIQNRMPTDDALWKRGCHIVSMCSLCCSSAETMTHLFFDCFFARCTWSWLASILQCNISTSSMLDVLSICSGTWSQQAMDVITAAIINAIHVIWFCRNKARFDNLLINSPATISMISADVHLAGTLSKGAASSNIKDFTILKAFNIAIHPCKAQVIKPVIWYPPKCSWIKCNTDGAAKGAPGPAACGGIFHDSGAAFLGCFSMPIGNSFALQADLLGAMLAIEIAYEKGWHNLWIECDSVLVISTFDSDKIVPWKHRNRWKNCLQLISRMNFRFSHIYREGNHCADKLASHGTSLQGFYWWHLLPSLIREDFFRNRFALPYYRFK